jgi:purine-binding chemotaxis protein CheW
MEKELQVVGFRIGNETYGVRIAAVREIVRVPEITSVPSAPDLIEGVINLRGKIIPVMDLRKRFGQADIQHDKKNRILVVELDNKLIGLIVNAASEVLKIPPSDIEAPGSVFAEGESGYVTGVGKLKGRLIILLDISKLLHRPEYKRLEEAAERLLPRSNSPKQSSSSSRRWSIRNAACFSMSAARTSSKIACSAV